MLITKKIKKSLSFFKSFIFENMISYKCVMCKLSGKKNSNARNENIALDMAIRWL